MSAVFLRTDVPRWLIGSVVLVVSTASCDVPIPQERERYAFGTEAERMSAGCVSGALGLCDDGNACTVDACDRGVICLHTLAAGACEDGDACTVGDLCNGGLCEAGPQRDCDDGMPCTTDTCTATTGACAHKNVPYDTCCGKLGSHGGGTCLWNVGAHKGNDGFTRPPTTWALIPGGVFAMGCSSETDAECQADEQPQRLVTVSKPFWMAATEATVADYKACVAAKACPEPVAWNPKSAWSRYCNWKQPDRDNHPVNCVDVKAATAFCTWRGGAGDIGGLPTEAQWELAARGRCVDNGGIKGCGKATRRFPWGDADATCLRAVMTAATGNDGCGKTAGGGGCSTNAIKGCGLDATARVASRPAGISPYGVLDMAGNVWEYTRDLYDAKFYQVSTTIDPRSLVGDQVVLRGGSFGHGSASLRAANRTSVPLAKTDVFAGIRCIRTY